MIFIEKRACDRLPSMDMETEDLTAPRDAPKLMLINEAENMESVEDVEMEELVDRNVGSTVSHENIEATAAVMESEGTQATQGQDEEQETDRNNDLNNQVSKDILKFLIWNIYC